MTYETRQKKKSEFTADNDVTSSSTFDFVKSGINKKTTWGNMLALFEQRFGLSMSVYEAESAMIADTGLELGSYAIVEENYYAVYKVTNIAAGSGDVTLSNGLTASQEGKCSNNNFDSYSDVRGLKSSAFKDGESLTLTDDGIAGDFVVKTGTVTDNGGTLIVFTDDSNRYAERVYEGDLSIKWFGAVGDGVTDDTSSIVATIAATPNLASVFAPTPDDAYLISSTIDFNRNLFCEKLATFRPDPAGTYTNSILGKKIVINMTRAGMHIKDARIDLTSVTGFVGINLALFYAKASDCQIVGATHTDLNWGLTSTSTQQYIDDNIFDRLERGYVIEFEGYSNSCRGNRFELCSRCIHFVVNIGAGGINHNFVENTFNFPFDVAIYIEGGAVDLRGLNVVGNYYEATQANTSFIEINNMGFTQGVLIGNTVLGTNGVGGQDGFFANTTLSASMQMAIMGNSFANLDVALNVNNSLLMSNEYFNVTTRNSSSSNTGTMEERVRIQDKSGTDNIVIRPNNIVGSVAGTLTMSNTGNLTLTSSGGDIILSGLPTSSAGLPVGALWNNSGVVNIV